MTIHDETPVLIAQDDWEFHQLLMLYERYGPKRVLEIGTYAGGTLYHWMVDASIGAHIVSVDGYTHHDNRHLYDEWCASGVTWSVVVGNTHGEETVEAVREWAPYDWIFFDAGHLDHEIRADVECYLPMAAEGAIVAFHDIVRDGPGNLQVHHVWDELRHEYRSAEFQTPGQFGIGVLFL